MSLRKKKDILFSFILIVLYYFSYEFGPLAHRLERAPYKRHREVQLLHGPPNRKH